MRRERPESVQDGYLTHTINASHGQVVAGMVELHCLAGGQRLVRNRNGCGCQVGNHHAKVGPTCGEAPTPRRLPRSQAHCAFLALSRHLAGLYVANHL